jgi:hypothetical protein
MCNLGIAHCNVEELQVVNQPVEIRVVAELQKRAEAALRLCPATHY